MTHFCIKNRSKIDAQKWIFRNPIFSIFSRFFFFAKFVFFKKNDECEKSVVALSPHGLLGTRREPQNTLILWFSSADTPKDRP